MPDRRATAPEFFERGFVYQLQTTTCDSGIKIDRELAESDSRSRRVNNHHYGTLTYQKMWFEDCQQDNLLPKSIFLVR
jgi:hypothetical protein